MITRFLWIKSWQNQIDKVPRQALKLLKHIPEDVNEAKSRSELAEETGWSTEKVRKYASYLLDSYLINTNQRQGRRAYQYWKTRDSLSLPVLQPDWTPLEEWAEKQSRIGGCKNVNVYEKKKFGWIEYVKKTDDTEGFCKELSEQDKALFKLTETDVPAKQDNKGKTTPQCGICVLFKKKECAKPQPTLIQSNTDATDCSSFKMALSDLQLMLREEWVKGYEENFITLTMEKGSWTREEAKTFFDQLVDEGKILLNPDGFWQWTKVVKR